MKSKAYVKSINLPPAPPPTRPVTIAEKHAPLCGLERITDEQRERAVKASLQAAENAWTYDEDVDVKRLYKQGLSLQEIANHFPERTYAAVCSKIRRMRKRGQI